MCGISVSETLLRPRVVHQSVRLSRPYVAVDERARYARHDDAHIVGKAFDRNRSARQIDFRADGRRTVDRAEFFLCIDFFLDIIGERIDED